MLYLQLSSERAVLAVISIKTVCTCAKQKRFSCGATDRCSGAWDSDTGLKRARTVPALLAGFIGFHAHHLSYAGNQARAATSCLKGSRGLLSSEVEDASRGQLTELSGLSPSIRKDGGAQLVQHDLKIRSVRWTLERFDFNRGRDVGTYDGGGSLGVRSCGRGGRGNSSTGEIG